MQYTVAKTAAHFSGILALQQANLLRNIDATEAKSEGFVSVEHNLELLQAMNVPHGHQIVVDQGKVVAYALFMLPHFAYQIPMLIPFIERLNTLNWQGKALKDSSYFIIGQLCVAKAYRGKGIAKQLYKKMAQRLAPHFELMLTEVATQNTASLRAHQKAGFQTAQQYLDNNQQSWEIVIYPLTSCE